MAHSDQRLLLAPVGSTGNNTHTSVQLGGTSYAVGFQLVVEAVGATPTITWKIQANVDGDTDEWFDLLYVTDATDAGSIAARTHGTPAAGDRFVQWLANPGARQYTHYRAVITANTNVTYRVEMLPIN